MVEVSRSKSINKYLESKSIQTIKQKTIALCIVKRDYFSGTPCMVCDYINCLPLV